MNNRKRKNRTRLTQKSKSAQKHASLGYFVLIDTGESIPVNVDGEPWAHEVSMNGPFTKEKALKFIESSFKDGTKTSDVNIIHGKKIKCSLKLE